MNEENIDWTDKELCYIYNKNALIFVVVNMLQNKSIYHFK